MILLSFDIEEFDMPIEYGQPITFEEQITISTNGIFLILDLLKSFNVKATFFCTANYALNRPIIISEIINEGHEIGSHSYSHSDFKIEHLLSSKIALEKITGLKVIGFRMPKMMRVNEYEIQKAGYIYNSSLNPTFIPGRYNNLNKPRSWFYEYGILQLPASVSSYLRFPLFWLTFHHVPLFVIKRMCSAAHERDGYLNLYFHPWEFVDLRQLTNVDLPGYITKNSGDRSKACDRQ